MTISDTYEKAYVWIWLDGASEPVVAGQVTRAGRQLVFTYGRSYLSNPDAISIYEPELPLKQGARYPQPGLEVANCLRDAAPDAWGRRIIINQRTGLTGREVDTGL